MAGTSPAMTTLTADAISLRARGGAFVFRGRLVLARLRALSAVGENNMADGGIGGRHGVETIDLVDFLIESAAHDQPHHHLDAFGAGLAHVVDVRNLDELLRIPRQVIQERLVPFAVDQAGPRTGNLV